MHSRETLTPLQREYRICLPDGTEKWVLAHSVPEREADGSTLWHGYMVDVSDKKRSEAKIYELAYFDTLTHLPNRIQLGNRLQRILASKRTRAARRAALRRPRSFQGAERHQGAPCRRPAPLRDRQAHLRLPRPGAFRGAARRRRVRRAARRPRRHRQATARRVRVAVGERSSPPSTSRSTSAKTRSRRPRASARCCSRRRDHDVEEVLKHADLAMYEAKARRARHAALLRGGDANGAADQLALTSELRARARRRAAHAPLPADRRRTRASASAPRPAPMEPPDARPHLRRRVHRARRAQRLHGLDRHIGCCSAACATLKGWEGDPLTRDLQLAVNVSAQRAEPHGVRGDRGGRARRDPAHGRTGSHWS